MKCLILSNRVYGFHEPFKQHYKQLLEKLSSEENIISNRVLFLVLLLQYKMWVHILKTMDTTEKNLEAMFPYVMLWKYKDHWIYQPTLPSIKANFVQE